MLLFQLLLLNLLQLLWAVVGSTGALPLIIQLVLEGQRSSSRARILLFPWRSVLVEGWRRRQLAMTKKRRLATLTTAASATQVVTYFGACSGKSVPLSLLIAMFLVISGVFLTAGHGRTTGRLLLSMNRAGPRLRTAAGGRGRIIGVSALAHFLRVNLLRPEVIRLAAAQLTYAGLWPRRLGGSASSWHLVGCLLPTVASSRCCDRLRYMALRLGHHRVASFILEKVG